MGCMCTVYIIKVHYRVTLLEAAGNNTAVSGKVVQKKTMPTGSLGDIQ